jgi:hypothetical protein
MDIRNIQYRAFVNKFKYQNPSLIESIQKGFNAIFEGLYQEIIGLGDLKSRQDDVNPEKWDTTQCRIFRDEWNRRYPNYPVAIKGNPHDFGTYYDIKMKEELFEKSYEDTTSFPNGAEQAAMELADELHLEY